MPVTTPNAPVSPTSLVLSRPEWISIWKKNGSFTCEVRRDDPPSSGVTVMGCVRERLYLSSEMLARAREGCTELPHQMHQMVALPSWLHVRNARHSPCIPSSLRSLLSRTHCDPSPTHDRSAHNGRSACPPSTEFASPLFSSNAAVHHRRLSTMICFCIPFCSLSLFLAVIRLFRDSPHMSPSTLGGGDATR
jgi:hypothetical protein